MVKDQKRHWDEVYSKNVEFFGEEPSTFAKQALGLFLENGASSVLELGPGQGRDTIFFAKESLEVIGLDYSIQSVSELNAKAQTRSLASRIKVQFHDVRQPLPFPDASFDACYSHMLLCMHLSEKDIAFALREIHRVLRPGGIAAYSVRSVFDKHYGHSAARYMGEHIHEVGGFVVHFFSEEMIRRLARGFEIIRIGRLEEGSLPRDLFTVFLKKASPINAAGEEESMQNVFGLYQGFFDATYGGGVLDMKTKFLIAMGASLVAGCDTWAQTSFTVAKEAGASPDELQEATAIAMTVQATRIRNVFNTMAAASQTGDNPGGAIASSPVPGRTWGK